MFEFLHRIELLRFAQNSAEDASLRQGLRPSELVDAQKLWGIDSKASFERLQYWFCRRGAIVLLSFSKSEVLDRHNVPVGRLPLTFATQPILPLVRSNRVVSPHWLAEINWPSKFYLLATYFQTAVEQYSGQNLSRFWASNPDSTVDRILLSKSGVELTLKK